MRCAKNTSAVARRKLKFTKRTAVETESAKVERDAGAVLLTAPALRDSSAYTINAQQRNFSQMGRSAQATRSALLDTASSATAVLLVCAAGKTQSAHAGRCVWITAVSFQERNAATALQQVSAPMRNQNTATTEFGFTHAQHVAVQKGRYAGWMVYAMVCSAVMELSRESAQATNLYSAARTES